jgi:hypothetical protein
MKGLDLVVQIYGALKQRADKLRNAGERDLVISICAAVSTIMSTVIAAAFLIALGPKAAIVSFLMASALLLPTSALVGTYVWELVPPLWLWTGNSFLHLKYLEYEYNRDIERIERLPMSDAKKAPLLLERYKKYLADTTALKERIVSGRASGVTQNRPYVVTSKPANKK